MWLWQGDQASLQAEFKAATSMRDRFKERLAAEKQKNARLLQVSRAYSCTEYLQLHGVLTAAKEHSCMNHSCVVHPLRGSHLLQTLSCLSSYNQLTADG